MLAHLGAAAGADRAYLFQNVRDPQGRLWMDLRAEWDAPGIEQVFEDPTIICTRTRRRSRVASITTGEETCSPNSCAICPGPSERCSTPRGCGPSCRCRSSCATNGGATSASTTAATSASGPTPRSTPCAQLQAPSGCSSIASWPNVPRNSKRTATARWWRAVRRSATSTPPTSRPRRSSSARRSRTCSDTHPRMGREPRDVAQAPASRRPCPGARRERAAQRDGRAVPHGIPHVPPRRSYRVGARRGDDGAGRPRRAELLSRRDDGYLRPQARRGEHRLPRLPRRAHRACRAGRCSTSCWNCRSHELVATTLPSP